MNMTVFSARGSAAAMQRLFEEVGGGQLGWHSVPSDSAFSRARRKSKPEDLRALLHTLRKECSHLDSHPHMRLRGFNRVAAVDGTKLTLSSLGTNKEEYGCPSGEHLAPQALMTLLWDVGGNVPMDWRIGRHDDAETNQLEEMLPQLKSGDLLLADRLYANKALMEHLININVDFVIRVRTGATALSVFEKFAQGSEREEIVDLPGKTGARVRLVRGYRRDTEDIIFATSVLENERLSPEAIADIYHRRWGIETAYREGKSWMALGNLPGRNRDQVEQEVAAVMIYFLMQGELEGQVRKKYNKEIREIDPKLPKDVAPLPEEISETPVRFNRNLAAVVIGGVIRKSMVNHKDAVTIWKVGMDNIWRHRSRRKPGRSYRRTSQRPHDFKKRDAEAKRQAMGGRTSC